MRVRFPPAVLTFFFVRLSKANVTPRDQGTKPFPPEEVNERTYTITTTAIEFKKRDPCKLHHFMAEFPLKLETRKSNEKEVERIYYIDDIARSKLLLQNYSPDILKAPRIIHRYKKKYSGFKPYSIVPVCINEKAELVIKNIQKNSTDKIRICSRGWRVTR